MHLYIYRVPIACSNFKPQVPRSGSFQQGSSSPGTGPSFPFELPLHPVYLRYTLQQRTPEGLNCPTSNATHITHTKEIHVHWPLKQAQGWWTCQDLKLISISNRLNMASRHQDPITRIVLQSKEKRSKKVAPIFKSLVGRVACFQNLLQGIPHLTEQADFKTAVNS